MNTDIPQGLILAITLLRLIVKVFPSINAIPTYPLTRDTPFVVPFSTAHIGRGDYNPVPKEQERLVSVR